MVLLSPNWIASKIQAPPVRGCRSQSNLVFTVLAVSVLLGLATLSVALGVATIDSLIFAAP